MTPQALREEEKPESPFKNAQRQTMAYNAVKMEYTTAQQAAFKVMKNATDTFDKVILG